MLVHLSEEFSAELEPPDLRTLIGGGGEVLSLARSCVLEPGVDLETTDRGVLYLIAEWAIETFCASEEAAVLASVCQRFGQAPSDRLGITERSLAWLLDLGCAAKLAEMEHRETDGEATRRRQPHRFSVPDTWSPEEGG